MLRIPDQQSLRHSKSIGHIFKTIDRGQSWVDVSGNLPDIPTNALLYDPNNKNILYAGMDIGVFRSTSGGNSWENFNNGMPPVVVFALAALPSGLIRLATHGRGIYELTAEQTAGELL